jgi:hypothetical protein
VLRLRALYCRKVRERWGVVKIRGLELAQRSPKDN